MEAVTPPPPPLGLGLGLEPAGVTPPGDGALSSSCVGVVVERVVVVVVATPIEVVP